jgi:hypothetical protein
MSIGVNNRPNFTGPRSRTYTTVLRTTLCCMIMLLGTVSAGCGSSDSGKDSAPNGNLWPGANAPTRGAAGGKFPKLSGIWESQDPHIPSHIDEFWVEPDGRYEHFLGDGTNTLRPETGHAGSISAVAGEPDTYSLSCTYGACQSGAPLSLTLERDKLRVRTSEGDRIFTWAGPEPT